MTSLNNLVLAAAVADIACVPLANVNLFSDPADKNDVGQLLVIIKFVCDKDECNVIQRMRYFLYITSQQPTLLARANVVGAPAQNDQAAFAAVDPSNPSGAAVEPMKQPGIISAVVIGCLVFLILVIVAVVIIVRKRRKRDSRHTTRFALDDVSPQVMEMANERPREAEDLPAFTNAFAAAAVPSPQRALVSEFEIDVNITPEKPLHD